VRCTSQLWVWALALGLLSLWPALQAFAPFGVMGGGSATQAAYEIAFMAALAGVASALHAIDELRSWSRALGLRTRVLAEWCALCLTGVVFEAVALALPWTVTREQPDRLGLAFVLGALVASAHLACGALAILRVPMPSGTRAFALVVLAWIVPAIAGSSSVLALFRPIPAFAGASSFRIVFIGELSAMVGLIAAARWLESSLRRDP
jgi:hypothetical protein